MKVTKMIIICALATFLLFAFCGCSMEDGKVNDPTGAPTATANTSTARPTAEANTAKPSATNNPDSNIGEDIGKGIQDIGDDIENASGAAKQVNG